MHIHDVFERYHDLFLERYGHQLNKDQWSALNAILGCRTEQYGEVHYTCDACDWQGRGFQSCGHRFCHRCQNHLSDSWLNKQEQKLLPVNYFMVTFTVPKQLRGLCKVHSATPYSFEPLKTPSSNLLKTIRRLRAMWDLPPFFILIHVSSTTTHIFTVSCLLAHSMQNIMYGELRAITIFFGRET